MKRAGCLDGRKQRRGSGFPEIEDQAFAQQRVEKFIDECGYFGFFHQVPDQEPVIEVHRESVGPIGPHQAFEPPIGGVEAVAEVGPQIERPQGLDFLDQPFFSIDPDMALVGVTIFIREEPADFFRPEPGHTHSQDFAGLCNPHQF